MKKEIDYLKEKIIQHLNLERLPSNIFKRKKGKSLPFVKGVKETSNLIIVKLSGVIDANTIPIIRGNYKHEIKQGLDKNVLLDFKEVTHVDSSTLASLLRAMSELKQKHRKLGLVNANHALKEYIAIAKLEFIIYVYDSIDEALEDINKETKSCPYFKTLDKNMKTGKCIINKKKPV